MANFQFPSFPQPVQNSTTDYGVRLFNNLICPPFYNLSFDKKVLATSCCASRDGLFQAWSTQLSTCFRKHIHLRYLSHILQGGLHNCLGYRQAINRAILDPMPLYWSILAKSLQLLPTSSLLRYSTWDEGLTGVPAFPITKIVSSHGYWNLFC